MKWIAISAVFLPAFFAFVLESAQESPSPVAAVPAEKRRAEWRKDSDAYLAAIDREFEEYKLADLLGNVRPEYLDKQYDSGIMTADLSSKCPDCEGWGLRNRERSDASLCGPCDASGLSIRHSIRKPLPRTRKMPRVFRVMER